LEKQPDASPDRSHIEATYLSPIYTLRSSERILGHGAVEQANRYAGIINEQSGYDEASSQYERLRRAGSVALYEVRSELSDVRTVLRNVDDTDGVMNRYLNGAAPLHIVHTLIRDAPRPQPETSWKQWLTQKATDDELLNVLQWHNDLIEQQTDSEAIEAAFTAQKETFRRTAQKMYEHGWFALPPKDIDDIRLVISDVFDMAMKERDGYYQLGTQEVVLRQGERTDRGKNEQSIMNDFQSSLTHELVHATVSYSYEAPGNPLAARWLNEAQTEETSRLFQYDAKLPVVRKDIYADERALRKLLLSKSTLPPLETSKLLMRAFTGNDEDTTAFVQHIDEAWGATDVIEKISQAISLEESRFVKRDHKLNRAGEVKALQAVHKKLSTNPNTVLLPGIDQLRYQLERADQEPKK